METSGTPIRGYLPPQKTTIKKSFATEGLFSMGISIELIPVVLWLERTILGYTQVFGLCF